MIGLFEILGLYISSISAMFSVCVMLIKLKMPCYEQGTCEYYRVRVGKGMFKLFDFALGFLFYAFRTLA